ncbi:unnamed protein product [Nippostrongylus brasiliensis]|uniref:MFS domain-containing protein n=1 Tax=Nippostrongylus brasiliensis TaxID=27835 RepID=A0A0N4XE70_NIPBR|nr:unnamed protein product [Nippostrongylus brasiliensis]
MPMDQSVDRVRLIIICLALSFCVNYQYAFSSTYTNSAVHSLQRFVEGTNTTESSDSTVHKFSWLWSILVSIWFVGFLPGIWASNWLIERFGRRAAFLIGNILSVVGSVLRCLAILIDEVYVLVGARVLCGFGAIGVILLAILPETPKYLVLQGEYQKAQLSLRFYHGGSSPISDSIKSIERDIGRASEENGKLSEIFAVPQLRASLKLFLAALQNTAALWTILFSSTFYLERADVEHRVAQWSSAIMAGSYVLGTITGAVLIERQESNLNFLHKFAYVICAEMRALVSYINNGCLAALAVFGFSFGAGVGPVARFIGAELVPIRYRSTVTAVGFTYDTIVSCATSFICAPLFHHIGAYAFLVLFVFPSTLCTLYLYLYLPETRGKEIEEITRELE